MVTSFASHLAPAHVLAAAAAGEKLPPPTRAAVIMALLGIALLGMLLVVIILLGGHWARRQGNYRRGPAVPPDRRPLSPDAAAPHHAVADRSLDGGDPAAADTIRPTDTWRDQKKSP